MTHIFSLARPLIGLDLETTGRNPRTARIVEIAFVLYNPDGTGRKWETLVNPLVPIPPSSTEKHQICDGMVADKPTFAQLAASLAKGFTGVDFAGFNVRYDIQVLEEEFKRVSIPWTAQDARLVDGFRLWQLGSPRTLSDAAEEFLGRKHEGAHDALQDIEVTMEIIAAQMQRYQMLPRDLTSLHTLQFPPDPNQIDKSGKLMFDDSGQPVFKYGKHKDVPLPKVERSYIRWVVDKSDFPDDTKAILRDVLKGVYPVKETNDAVHNA